MTRICAKWPLVFLIVIVVAVTGGCGGDDGGTGPTITNNKMILNFFNISPLPSGWYYQAWAYKGTSWEVGPAFNLDSSLDLLDTQGQAIAGNKITFGTIDLTDCDSVRVTIQQSVATGPSTAGLTLLTAALGSAMSFNLESPLIGNVDAKDLNFVYGTPTDSDTSEANEVSGVWFTDEDFLEHGLDSLPDLPDGYIFEGWVKQGDFYLSTGKFAQSTGADLQQYYYTNAAGAPPFPGEDFLDNTKAPDGLTFPLDLDVGDRVFISIELANDPIPELPFIPWYVKVLQIKPVPQFKWFMNGGTIDDWPTAVGFIVED